MKILHVLNSLYPAGAENLVTNLANRQVKTHDVSLFTFYSEHDIFDEILDKKIKFYPHKKISFFSYKKISHLKSIINKHDVIHVHLFPPFYIVSFLTFFFKNKKFVYTEHNTNNRRRKKMFRLLEKKVYKNYNHVICISKATNDSLKKWVGDKIKTTVINNFIDIQSIKQIKAKKREEIGLSDESRLIVMVGRFVDQKDQDTVAKAIQRLPINYELILIGIGEREEKLKNLVKSLKIQKRVHFMGVRKDVVSILKACDYGVLSSRWEGFGIVALEYMASDLIAIGK